jgi:hypothetical protein
VTAKELAAASGFSAQHILHAVDTGKIMALCSNARTAKGKEQRLSVRIPREAAVAWMVSVANYDAEMVATALREIVDRLPPSALAQIQSHTERRLRERTR